MRNASLILSVALLSLFVVSSDVLAQSGSRGGGRPRVPGGVMSRVGGARSKTIPGGGRPTGIMNSANALIRSGQTGASRGSGPRGGAGFPSAPRMPSMGGGGGGNSGRRPAPLSGISRPSRRSKSSSKTVVSSTGAGSALALSSTVPEGFRVWTDSTGRFSIQGKLAAQQNGMVWIRRTDGKLTKLQTTKLSAADQRFLTNGS